jgi:hypothetical protein
MGVFEHHRGPRETRVVPQFAGDVRFFFWAALEDVGDALSWIRSVAKPGGSLGKDDGRFSQTSQLVTEGERAGQMSHSDTVVSQKDNGHALRKLLIYITAEARSARAGLSPTRT